MDLGDEQCHVLQYFSFYPSNSSRYLVNSTRCTGHRKDKFANHPENSLIQEKSEKRLSACFQPSAVGTSCVSSPIKAGGGGGADHLSAARATASPWRMETTGARPVIAKGELMPQGARTPPSVQGSGPPPGRWAKSSCIPALKRDEGAPQP